MSFENLPPNFDISQDGTHAVFNLPIVKSAKDDRSYKLIRLPNHLEALLIHDSVTDKAGAALDVAVGSFANPEHLQGLAHYLEHLLFMGTEKYPGENEYSEYLVQHNGRRNAFTSNENTCYFFEVNHEYLDEALDRFAQFFICPLFKPDANDRELKAVDSEFKTRQQKNFSRRYQLFQTHCNPLHPKHKFNIGNLKSLKEIPKQKGLNVHEEIRKFYDQHYSANIMKLTILGRDSLEQMTKWVVEKFSAIKNKEGVSSFKHTELPYTKAELCKQIAFKPIQEGHNICVLIPLPVISPYYKSKPGRYISHCVGHEGVGSIFSLLKNKGWIISLDAGSREDDSIHRSFEVDIRLTDEGLKNYEEVIETIFQYIEMLRRTGPQEWIFREIQAINEIKFRFKEKINATIDTLYVACNMKKEYPRELILSAPNLFYEYDPKAISECLKSLTIKNALVVMNSQNLSGFDRKEKWFGTEYKYQEISEKLIKALENPNIHPDLKLPAPNQFIPTNFDMNKLENLTPATRPDLIKDTSISRVWYKKDDKWWVPKAEIMITLRSPLLYISPSSIVKTKLYIDLFNQAIAEEVYDASAAYFHFHLYTSGSKIQLSINGYNDKCSNLLSVIINKMKNLVIESDQFTYIKEKAKMDYKNILLSLPASQSGRYLRGILSEKFWRPEDYLKALEDISEQDIKDFYPALLKNLYIESYFLGNLEKQDVLDMVTKIENTFSPKELIKMQLIGDRNIHLSEGKKYVFQHSLEDKDEPNSAVSYYIQIGDVMDLNKSCKLRLVNQIVKEYVFNELRTKEQLGYIVMNYLSLGTGEMGLNFIINSEKDTVYLENRIEAFISIGQKLIEEMTDEDYKIQQKSLIDSLLEKNKNLRGEACNHFNRINSGYYDFDRKTRDAEEVKKILKSELLEFYNTWFVPSSPSIKKLSVHSRSQKCISKPIDGESENDYKLSKDNIIVEDIIDFKSKMYLGPTAFPVVDLKTYFKE